MSRKLDSIVDYLSTGRTLTVRQARSMFKMDNIWDAIYRLRNEGYPIYTNRTKLRDGTETFAYRLGDPSARHAANIKSGHISRARRALYQNAISA